MPRVQVGFRAATLVPGGDQVVKPWLLHQAKKVGKKELFPSGGPDSSAIRRREALAERQERAKAKPS